jgi:hypothetical protein
MSVERILAAVPYVGTVVPRGARKPRDVCFRAEAALEVRTAAASDLEIAVRTGGEPDGMNRRREYIGYDRALWLPVLDDLGRPMTATAALGAIAAGGPRLGAQPNPFGRIGRTLRVADFEAAAPLEEMPLRRLDTEDRVDVLARAARVAADLLLVDDGRILRRSVGPFWKMAENVAPYVVNPEFSLPTTGGILFGVLREDDAAEFADAEWGLAVSNDFLEIGDRRFIEDRDALIAARAIANFRTMQGMAQIAKARPSLDPLLSPVLEAAGRLYGRDHAELSRGLLEYPACPGMPELAPSEIVEAAEGMRAFFENPLETRNDDVRKAFMLLRKQFETSVGPAVRRWDVHERDRLGVADEAPEIMPASPGAAA